MSEIEDALALLDGICGRDQIDEHEKLPAWRAIQILYRNGVHAADCEAVAVRIPILGKPACGQTLAHYLTQARWSLERRGLIAKRAQAESRAARVLGEWDISFEISFALGQMGASHFIAAHSKIPEVRWRAIDRITALIAERFKGKVVTVTPPKPPPPFGASRMDE